jgi:hypothetical protein
MRYRPSTPTTEAILRPPCPKCGTKMHLARIEPEKPGYETRTFECPNCEHSLSIVAKP